MSREADVKQIRDVLGALIVWMAQSANSPISQREAKMLLDRLAVERKEAR